MIESGRYHQIPRENRLCPSCRSNEIEDEIHFLFNSVLTAPSVVFQGTNFTIQCSSLFTIEQLPPIEVLKKSMNSSNYFVNLQWIKFALSRFDLRSKLLSIQNITPG